ncbi:MAG: hypothetical protein HZB27_09425 [Meiothermus silvanus]|nr:hypothetical protein [Allomeiothermus silvanus]
MKPLLALRERHLEAWMALRDEPFVQLLAAGRVPPAVAKRWLEQCHYWDEGLLRFLTRLLRKAPQPHRRVLALAIQAIVEEIDVLRADEELDLSAPIHPSRQEYLNFLQELEAQPYPVAMVMHWVLYRVFFDTWFSAKPQDGPLAEFSELWSTPELQALQRDLSGLAVEMMAQADPAELDRLIERALELERQSWKMAWEFVQEARPTLI